MSESGVSTSAAKPAGATKTPQPNKPSANKQKPAIARSADIPKTKKPPKINGKLDDPVWKKAAKISNFTQFNINEGQPATEDTIVYVTYDDENIYFGIRCFDKETKKIRANVSNRDNISADDRVMISLDTFNSKKRSFVFGVNPYGIQTDGLGDENDAQDLTWDAVFKSKGNIDDQGWTAEIAIPLKSLRLPKDKVQEWGLLIVRHITRKNETASWPPLSRKIRGQMQQAGTIKGIEFNPPQPFELTPYVALGYQWQLNPEANKLDGNLIYDTGIDLKYGLSSDTIVDLTINPDFSQIEADADQIDVNRRYELYFPEKRPFFLEGSDKFKSPIEVFYSRRIANPLFGAKITGTSGRYNFGYITALDKGVNEAPDALYNIFRLQRDLPNQSSVGLIFTDKEYQGQSSHLGNRLFGIDTRLRFMDHYTLTFQGIESWTSAEINGQPVEASDPAVHAQLQRDDGTLYTDVSYLDIGPEFNAEAGYLKRTGIRKLGGNVEYNFRPETWIENWAPFTSHESIFDYESGLSETSHRFGLNFNFESNTRLVLSYNRESESWRESRYFKNTPSALLTSAFSKIVSGSLFFSMGDALYYDKDHQADPQDPDNSYSGWRYQTAAQLVLKPDPKLNIDLTAQWENFSEDIQGDEVYSVWLLRGLVNYQITPEIFVRTIAQGNTYDETLGLNGLFGYVPSAGTVFYLGYNENLQFKDDDVNTSIGRTLFSKFAYHLPF